MLNLADPSPLPLGGPASPVRRPSLEEVWQITRFAHWDSCLCAERQLRKQVEAELGVDLTDRKAIIRAEVQCPLRGRTQDYGAHDTRDPKTCFLGRSRHF